MRRERKRARDAGRRKSIKSQEKTPWEGRGAQPHGQVSGWMPSLWHPAGTAAIGPEGDLVGVAASYFLGLLLGYLGSLDRTRAAWRHLSLDVKGQTPWSPDPGPDGGIDRDRGKRELDGEGGMGRGRKNPRGLKDMHNCHQLHNLAVRLPNGTRPVIPRRDDLTIFSSMTTAS